jgi:FkbM family methyltransferase
MIDVGAHIGTTIAPFMEKDWEIHAFEPDPDNRKRLLSFIKDNKNIKLSTNAVTNKSGLELSFYSSEVSSGISGLSNFHKSHKEIAKVKTITLKDYVRQNSIQEINFLKIDTEGHDLFVLEGFDWINDSHPEIIICEFEDNKSKDLGYTTKDLIMFLREQEYIITISEWYPIIEYGSKHRWKRFLQTENVELLDSNSWGNLIAIKQVKNLQQSLNNIIN